METTKKFYRHITCIVCFWAVGIAGSVCAQTHDLSMGGHAGVSMYFTNGDFRNLPGATVGLDLAYTVRGYVGNQTALGLKLGANISYAGACHSKSNYDEQYVNVDYYKEDMDYTITSKTFSEYQHQIQLEIPVYLSFITHGITINVGAKFMMPFFQKRQIDLKDAHITAYYPDFWVPVTDYLATGRFENGEYHDKRSSNMAKLNILLSAEIGYEWRTANNHRMGLLLYVDYGLWNNYSNNPPRYRLVDVAPILNTEYPVPDIKVNALTDTYASKANYMSVGVKFYYSFHKEMPKKYPCHCVTD